MTTRRQRRQAESLLEDTFIEKHGRNQWKVNGINGKTLQRANTKTMALYLACEIEGKEQKLLAI